MHESAREQASVTCRGRSCAQWSARRARLYRRSVPSGSRWFRWPRARLTVVVLVGVYAGVVGLSAQARLELRWDGVTSGAVVADPMGLHTRDGGRLLVLTEDRQARLYTAAGNPAGGARTGLRRVAGWLETPGAMLLVPVPGRSDALQWLAHADGRLAGGGRLVSVDRALVPDARFVQMDGEGLLYSLDADGMVAHASLVGGVLWERSLPGRPVAALPSGGRVIVPLSSGRVMILDGAGRGRELVDLQTPLTDGVADSRDPRLVLRGNDGRVMGLALPSGAVEEPRRPEELVRWTRLAEPADRDPVPDMAIHASGSEWQVIYPERDGGVAALDWRGRVVWERRVPGSPIERIVSLAPAPYVALVDRDARIVVLGGDGRLSSTVQLRSRPARVVWSSRTGQLVVTYADWGIEVYDLRFSEAEQRSLPSTQEGGPGAGTAVPPQPDPFGALRARADAVLAGSSRAERVDLLDSLRSQRERAVLFGRVGEASSILAEMLSEAYRAPQLRTGRVINDFPDLRRAVVGELALIMDRRSRSALAEAIALDPDPTVVAASLAAWASWGRTAAIADPALSRFRRADAAGRAILAPALIDVLEFSDLAATDPAAAQALVDQLVRSDVSGELRRRAARWSRGGR